MKIFPGNHAISQTKDVTVDDIPLAYITKTRTKIHALVNVEPEFCKPSTSGHIYPYQAFPHDELLFFDSKNDPVEGAKYMRRNGKKYYFEPKDSIEFIPTNFTFKSTVCRDDRFKNNVDYDIKIGTYTTELAEQIIGVFNKSNENKPLNIKVNGDDPTPMSMINMNIKDVDFLFVPKPVFDENSEMMLKLLDENVNLWIIGDDFEGVSDTEAKEYVLEDPQIYNGSVYTPSREEVLKSFNPAQEISKFPKKDFEYISLFKNAAPILVLKKDKKGFVILSTKSIVEHVQDYGSMILEMVVAIYLNSYFTTNPRTRQISDEKIDYYIRLRTPFNEYHTRINLEDVLFEDGYNLDINYDYVDTNFDRDDIRYTGQNRYGDLLFRKTSKTDPPKKENTISIYTTKNTIVNYDYTKTVIRIVEDRLNISNERDYIYIEPFRSTINHVCLPIRQAILIPDNSEYVLVWLGKSFDLIKAEKYTPEAHGKKYATIKLDWDIEFETGDSRQGGGGECYASDNYEMIDTGSLHGRPYRLGSTMVITLPEVYESKKDIILPEIQKHISSAEYPILLFKD